MSGIEMLFEFQIMADACMNGAAQGIVEVEAEVAV